MELRLRLWQDEHCDGAIFDPAIKVVSCCPLSGGGASSAACCEVAYLIEVGADSTLPILAEIYTLSISENHLRNTKAHDCAVFAGYA